MNRRPKGDGSYEYDEKQERWIWKIYINKRKYYLTSKKKSVLRKKVEEFQKNIDKKILEKEQEKAVQEIQETVISNPTVEEWSERWLNASRQ